MKKTLIILAVVIFFGAIGYLGRGYATSYIVSPLEETLGGLYDTPPLDVVGTRTGTSTTEVGFYEYATASTSYPTFIGRSVDLATYRIFVTEASSTAQLNFAILASDMNGCDTSATSTEHASYVYTQPITSEVKWYDASDHLKNRVHQTSFSNATTTFAMVNPDTSTGRELILEDLSSQCIALVVNGSSTVARIELSTKDY